ncbi:MAG TPA: hypothetical protein VIJ37_02395, partial [Steroidobacteraceae bacterium]
RLLHVMETLAMVLYRILHDARRRFLRPSAILGGGGISRCLLPMLLLRQIVIDGVVVRFVANEYVLH